MDENNSNPTALGRTAVRSRELVKPNDSRKLHTTLSEKLRKYESRPMGHEFIPAMMHTLTRIVEGEEPETLTEDRLENVLKSLGDDARFLHDAVDEYRELDSDLKSRALSTRYLGYPLNRPIPEDELVNVLERTNFTQGWTSGSLTTGAEMMSRRPLSWIPELEITPVLGRNDYSLTFSHFYCVDESNPEWPGSDEPYAVFAGTTEEMVESGTPAWGVNTKTYGNVDDGDRRPTEGEENLSLYGRTSAKPIDSPFLVATTFMEHDNGDPSEVSKGLRASLTVVATTAAGIGGPAGWIVAGAAGIGVGITFLVDLWAEDDQIGDVLTVALTEEDAKSLTSTVNPRVLNPLHFDGGSDDGIYDVYLKLKRS